MTEMCPRRLSQERGFKYKAKMKAQIDEKMSGRSPRYCRMISVGQSIHLGADQEEVEKSMWVLFRDARENCLEVLIYP